MGYNPNVFYSGGDRYGESRHVSPIGTITACREFVSPPIALEACVVDALGFDVDVARIVCLVFGNDYAEAAWVLEAMARGVIDATYVKGRCNICRITAVKSPTAELSEQSEPMEAIAFYTLPGREGSGDLHDLLDVVARMVNHNLKVLQSGLRVPAPPRESPRTLDLPIN